IATNPDVTGPSPDGPLPATGAVAAMITAATGRKPYFVGKPNPVMIRTALHRINAHSEHTAMIGDRLHSDQLVGMESRLRAVLAGTPASVIYRTAPDLSNAHSHHPAMIGDRMDTDILAGMESGPRTYLVLTGSTDASEVESFSYRPTAVADGIADLVDMI